MHRSGILWRNFYKSQVRKGLQLRPLRFLLSKVHLIILFSNEFLILLPLLLWELFIVSKYEFVPIPLNTFPDIINWSKYASRAITLNGVNFWYNCWGRWCHRDRRALCYSNLCRNWLGHRSCRSHRLLNLLLLIIVDHFLWSSLTLWGCCLPFIIFIIYIIFNHLLLTNTSTLLLIINNTISSSGNSLLIIFNR